MITYYSYKKVEDLRVGDTVYRAGIVVVGWIEFRIREFYPKSNQILLENPTFLDTPKYLIYYTEIQEFPSTQLNWTERLISNQQVRGSTPFVETNKSQTS